MKTKKHLDRETFSAYFDDILQESEKQKIREHLGSCNECRKVLEEMEAVRKLLKECPVKEPGVGFQTAILNRIEEGRKPHAFRTWSRRVSLSLGGLALVLIVFLLVSRSYPPPLTIKPEQVVIKPQPGINKTEKRKEKKILSFTKATKHLSGPTSALYRRNITPYPTDKSGTDRKAPDFKTDISYANINKAKFDTVSAPPVSTENREEAAKEETTKIVAENLSLGGNVKASVQGNVTAGTPLVMMKLADSLSTASPQNTIIRTEKEWTKVWNVQNTAQNFSAPQSQIDFKNQMVIAVPTRQNNREFRIVNTEDKENKIIVQYRETLPSKDAEKTLPPYQLEIVNNRPSVEFQKVK